MKAFDFEWQIVNEVRDLANFKSLTEAIKLTARHYKVSEEWLLSEYRKHFEEEGDSE